MSWDYFHSTIHNKGSIAFIIFEGVKMGNTQFGQNFEAIFRENEGLSEHGPTPVEFVMPKSSFPQKFGQGFAL